MPRQWEQLSAAYRHRLVRQGITPEAYERGVDLRQARGHTPFRALVARDKYTLTPKPSTIERVAKAAEDIRNGTSLTKAAKAHHVSPETVRQVGYDRRYLSKTYAGKQGRWGYVEHGDMPVVTAAGAAHEIDADIENRRTIAEWRRALYDLTERGDPSAMARLATTGVVVTDRASTRYRLMTDPDELFLWYESLTDRQQAAFGREFYVTRKQRAA